MASLLEANGRNLPSKPRRVEPTGVKSLNPFFFRDRDRLSAVF
jgi:hypothetical protein